MFDSAKKIKNFVLISILVLVTITICFQNYTSGTYLSGWDTLHSEFNFEIAFTRALSPTFQEHQGLGAVSSQSHIGDLPRIVFLFILSFLLDDSLLRYSYVFLMLLIGPLGVYFFLKNLFEVHNDPDGDDSNLYPSFIGAIFYLTNLSVVQHFNVPLEMFLTLYGFLGFIFLYVFKVIENPDKKNIFYLSLFSFLVSPSSHTATLFYMFVFILSVFVFINFLNSDDKKVTFKNSIVAFGTVLFVNLFWILPNVYYILTRGVEVSNSKIHTLFSDQAYLSNLSFGNIYDIALLKNYLFIWQIWDGQKFVPLLNSWINHLNTGINLYGFLVFLLSILGIGITIARREKKLYGFIVIFFLSFFFISSSNSILGSLFDFIRENFPLLKEALRFPFNKFSTIFSFVISVFLAYSTLIIFNIVKRESLKFSSTIIFFVFSIIYFLPAFQGNLINPLMRIDFKDDYFEVFDYFKKQEEYGRIADFPVHSVYGWSYYGFDYQGAGFLWFGIDKPLLNREFDRWNVKNEDYYNEMSFAVYNNNPEMLEQVLNKYQIKWVLIDKNVFAPNEKSEILHFDKIENTFEEISNLKLDKRIGANIYIYKYSPDIPYVKSQVLEDVNYLSNEHFRESFDLPYSISGNYYSNFSKEVSFGLKTPTEILNTDIVSSDDENFYFRNLKNSQGIENLVTVNLRNSTLEIKTLDKTATFSIPSTFDLITLDNSILRRNETSQLKVSSSSEIKTYNFNEEFIQNNFDNFVSVDNCGTEAFGSKYSVQRNLSNYILTSANTTSCLNFDLRDFLGTKVFDFYILTFKVENQNSNSYFCVLDEIGKECNKTKLSEINQIILDSNDTNFVLFNEPLTNLDSSSIFSEIEINLLSQIDSLSLKFEPEFFQKSESLSLKKDLKFSGNLKNFGSNPRVCQTQDLIEARTGLYESSEYNICDNLNIDYNPSNYHLVEIKSKNNYGLPLRLCLQNSNTFRCDVFMSLPKNKDFKSDFILLPPYLEPHNLAITNQVIEGNTSSNEISYLSVRKLDYQNLFGIESQNSAKIYAYYKSFDRGFIAWCGFWACPYEHVLVNNWANGWVLPQNYNLNDSPILVIFWPNYLGILGILVAILWFWLVPYLLKFLFKPIEVDKKS